jgi:2-polyprenyl-3-methyl-5-hydroxy-6-metoxy-1,4-benzoquinol methylase
MGVRHSPDTQVWLCGYCNIQYIEPHYDDLGKYYREEYRLQHESVLGQPQTAQDRYDSQVYTTKEAAKSIKDLVPEGGSVLDIGCSAGGLLSHLEDSYELYGAEWNQEDAQYIRKAGYPCEEGELTEIYPNKRFTAISALAVLEHQPDPVQFIKDIKDKLIGGGYLYMETPNIADALLTMYDIPEYKDFWYRKPHITYWNVRTLGSLLTNLGFEARLDFKQRYGLANHMHWLHTGRPMDNMVEAQAMMHPIPKQQGNAAAFNRIMASLDHMYRVQLRTLFHTDTLVVKARLMAI